MVSSLKSSRPVASSSAKITSWTRGQIFYFGPGDEATPAGAAGGIVLGHVVPADGVVELVDDAREAVLVGDRRASALGFGRRRRQKVGNAGSHRFEQFHFAGGGLVLGLLFP
jgi:hypothetical protein